jgi:hypothetical protein
MLQLNVSGSAISLALNPQLIFALRGLRRWTGAIIIPVDKPLGRA